MRASEIRDKVTLGELTVKQAYVMLATELEIKERMTDDFYKYLLLPAVNQAIEESKNNAQGGDHRYELAFQDGVNHIASMIWSITEQKQK